MDREIKFRVWLNINKVMIDNKSIPILVKNLKNDGFYTFMQFTGLYDKNGVEIYEGDIVKTTRREKICKVIFNSIGCFCLQFIDNTQNDFIPKGCEVIGNIYETPELLK